VTENRRTGVAFRVLIYDRVLERRMYAYGADGRELRYKTMEEASAAVHPLVGAEKRWPCLYVIEQAPSGPAPMVVEPKPARTFRRLSGTRELKTGRA
jgi:hypothetical protein